MLNFTLRLHGIICIPYAVLLIFFPGFTLDLLADGEIGLGVEVGRLLGAAMILLTIITWRASYSKEPGLRKSIIFGVCCYTLTGFVISLIGQLQGHWGVLGWSNVIEYLFFGAVYATYLLRNKTV